MGFPDEFPLVSSDTQTYIQMGNTSVPPLIQAIGEKINSAINQNIPTV